MLDPVPKAIEKSLMEIVNLWYLIEDVLDEAWICNTCRLGSFERLQVNLYNNHMQMYIGGVHLYKIQHRCMDSMEL